MTGSVYRFAPSPNGALHLGHAYSALLNQRLARESAGTLLLRIEDIDVARCNRAFEAGILDDLRWLGIEWETPVRRQSEHFADYAEALRRLIAADLVYPGFMSRGEVHARVAEAEAGGAAWQRDPDGAPLYPGLDRTLPERTRRERMDAGRPFAWRLDMAAACARLTDRLHWSEASEAPAFMRTVEAQPQLWGDLIVARSDIPTSYPLAVVVDDALQGVTHVVRGADLFAATDVQRLLQLLLGLATPIYRHHPLILGPDGRKLSKSAGSETLRTLREGGTAPGDIPRRLGLGP